jgi:general secretion pathway protein M
MIRLTRREKLLAGGLVFFTGAWLLFTAGVKPAIARIGTLKRVISQKQQELEKIRACSREFIFLRNSLNNLRTRIASQDEIFELLPFLESLVEECGLTENISIMKQRESPIDNDYSETIVEIKLQNLTLNRLVDLLYNIESSQALAGIKSLYIKKDTIDEKMLDVVIEINNAKLN